MNRKNKTGRDWVMLGICIGAAFIAGVIGSSATFPSVREWYPTLNKPSWNPPNWLFAPVWTTLYVLMGIAVWRAWLRRFEPGVTGVKAIVSVYFVQLALNALWSVLFFGMQQPGWALREIVILLLALIWMQRALLRVDKIAALLWLPYVLWVTFATALNSAIVRLN